MKRIYRVKTIYHLLQAIALEINFPDNDSTLYIDDVSLRFLNTGLSCSNIFGSVFYLPRPRFKYLDLLLSIIKFYCFSFLSLKKHKTFKFYTCCHNVPSSIVKYFAFSNNGIIVLEDGNYSYQLRINSQINPIFNNKIIGFKRMLNSFFISFYRSVDDRFLYLNQKRLSNTTFLNEFKEKIISFSLQENIIRINKNDLFNVFLGEQMMPEIADKSLILITQPTHNLIINQLEYKILLENSVNEFPEHKVYIKNHPRETEPFNFDFENDVEYLPVFLPLELFFLFQIKFDVAITYNSTGATKQLAEKVIFLDKFK